MINKLISKTQVRLLEYDGNPSQDYKDGYCRAINDVLDLESIPTLGADEYEKFKADYENRLKADMVAMLEDLKQDFIAEAYGIEMDCTDYVVNVADIDKVIQQKINLLKAESEDKE